MFHKEADGRNVFIYIRKNKAMMTQAQHRMQNMDEVYDVVTFYDYMEVKEGDLIQLYIAIDNANFTSKRSKWGWCNTIISKSCRLKKIK